MMGFCSYRPDDDVCQGIAYEGRKEVIIYILAITAVSGCQNEHEK